MFEEIVGNSPALQAVIARVSKPMHRITETDATVDGTKLRLDSDGIGLRQMLQAKGIILVNCSLFIELQVAQK
jgi:hypothetical protein